MWEKLPESKIHQESLHRLYPVYTSPEPDSEFVQSEAFLNTTKLSVSGSAYSTVTLPLRKTQLKNGTTSFLSFFLAQLSEKAKKNCASTFCTNFLNCRQTFVFFMAICLTAAERLNVWTPPPRSVQTAVLRLSASEKLSHQRQRQTPELTKFVLGFEKYSE